MSLLKTVKPEEATGQVAQLYEPMLQRFGMVPAPMLLMSASPGLMALQMDTIAYFVNHPNLSQGLLALIRMLVSEELRYSYCVSLNREALKKMGIVDDDQLGAILADPSTAPIGDKEKAMLLLVLKVCSKPETVTAEEVQNLRDLGWLDSDILDAVTMGLRMMQGGILEKAFGLPEGSSC